MNELKSKLNEIFQNKISGSKELQYNLIELIKSDPEYFIRNTNVISEIKSKLGHFQTILFLCEKIEQINSAEELEIYLQNYAKQDIEKFDKLFYSAKDTLLKHNKFITISNSRTLQFVFQSLVALGHKFEVTVCESRPKNEGVILAEFLAESGIRVNLITEAQIGSYIQKCDSVLIGADKILSNGSVINKTGSLTLAICAKYFNIPLYVVADSSKYSPSNLFSPPVNSATEIYSGKSNLLNIVNNYFENINAMYITNIFTD